MESMPVSNLQLDTSRLVDLIERFQSCRHLC